jgi:hypothetical protein
MKAIQFTIQNQSEEDVSLGFLAEKDGQLSISFTPHIDGVWSKELTLNSFDEIQNFAGFIAANVTSILGRSSSDYAYVVIKDQKTEILFDDKEPENEVAYCVTTKDGKELFMQGGVVKGVDIYGNELTMNLSNIYRVMPECIPKNKKYGKDEVLNYILSINFVPIKEIKPEEKNKLLQGISRARKKNGDEWIYRARVGGIYITVNKKVMDDAKRYEMQKIAQP